MAFVSVVPQTRGLGAVLRRRYAGRPLVAHVRLHRRRGLRGLGQQICAPGLTLVTLPDGSTTCQSTTRNTVVGDWDPGPAFDYPQAPGCHVVDLSRNICKLDDGSVYGCNAILECDPLSTATHGQYSIPGPPVYQPGGEKTISIQQGTSDTNPIYHPVLGLKAPTGGVPSTFKTPAQIQAAIAAALGSKYASKQLQTASASSAQAGGSSSGTVQTQTGDGTTASPTSSFLPAGFSFGFLSKPVSLFGFHIPTWLLVAGGGGLLYAFSGWHRR